MNINLKTSLRSVVTALFLVIFFSPVTANAYTSSGADGPFQPTTSVVLNSTQSIFDFTNIFIPSGVTVSFSGLSSAQPIELLATGNIDIAGTINMGANSLWIETPGSLSVSGSLNSLGGTLSLVASNVNLSGSITGTVGSGSGAGGGSCSGSGADSTIQIGSGSGTGSVISGSCYVSPVIGGGIIVPYPNPTISLSPVPEPDVWVMLSLGLCALFAVSRLRNQKFA